MTAIPLVCFGAAANRVPLSLLGVLQYFAPTLQFLCGVLVFHEQMSSLRWLGFGLIWLSLIGFATEGLFAHRAARATASTTGFMGPSDSLHMKSGGAVNQPLCSKLPASTEPSAP
jgi:chloramphenicol-sensitive protein RarD